MFEKIIFEKKILFETNYYRKKSPLYGVLIRGEQKYVRKAMFDFARKIVCSKKYLLNFVNIYNNIL